jgi:hypothetical protein
VEELTRIAMVQGIDIAVIAPIKEKTDEFRLDSDKAKMEGSDIKPRCRTCSLAGYALIRIVNAGDM